MLPQPKSSGDEDAPQPKASGDQNILQYQKATSEVAKSFVEAIVFAKTPWPIVSDDNHSMVEDASILAIEAQDGHLGFTGVLAGTLSVSQLPSSRSPKIDPQTQNSVSLGLSLTLIYQIYDIEYSPKYT
jgi:hypothetical protein